MRIPLVVLAGIALLFHSGCEKTDPTSAPPIPLPPQMTGTWSGGTGFLLRINVVEQQSSIIGAGMFNGNIGAFVNGKSTYPSVRFTIESKGYAPTEFTGSYVHPDTIVGALNGSGFFNVPVILGKQ